MIATAIEQNGYVYVYDESGSILFSRSGQLMGFTSTTVSIKENGCTYVYDANGNIKFSRF